MFPFDRQINKKEKMFNNGNLIISLDFELLWGVFDVVDYEERRKYFENTRQVIPQILDLFNSYNIKATWATVGMLFNENWEEWNKNKPDLLPKYKNRTLSAYQFGDSIQDQNTEDLCFAPNLIKLIQKTPGQEIGTHTYSHYYCMEPGQDIETFKADLDMAVKLAGNMDISMKSLVFPRNQIREEYLEVCYKTGISNVRSNPSAWYWKDASSNALSTKLARTGDAYLPLGKKSYSGDKLIFQSNKAMQQKASRFLRPVEGNSQLRKLKMNRILSEMTYAAKNKEVYHLWWHPHNFGDQPGESLKDLKILLDNFQMLHKMYNFRSASMGDLGNSHS